MPQLNPGPWFWIFFLTWTIFVMISVLKISHYHLPNNPSSKHFKNLTPSWLWPWP